MLRCLPSLNPVRLLAALLLATIGLQAGESFDSAQQPTHGSAFSATTVEVAVVPQRRSGTVVTAVAPLPAEPPRMAALGPLPTSHLAALPAARPDSTGPPVAVFWARPSAPRAPPLA